MLNRVPKRGSNSSGGADQAQVALADQVFVGQAAAAELAGDGGDQAEVGLDHAVAGVVVAAGDPGGQLDLLVAREPGSSGITGRRRCRVESSSIGSCGRVHGVLLRCDGAHAGRAGLRRRTRAGDADGDIELTRRPRVSPGTRVRGRCGSAGVGQVYRVF